MAEDNMKRLSSLARTLLSTKAKIAKLTADLEALAAQETRIEAEDIPELMRELEMKNFTLKDGTKIEVTEDIQCGITVANRPAAHAWLRKNKLGGVIKIVVAQQYTVGESATALSNAAQIKKLTGHDTSLIESVHAGTLKALLKEQRAKGTKIPTALFGLFPFSKAKVIPPKG
jgi:hypothetical protein